MQIPGRVLGHREVRRIVRLMAPHREVLGRLLDYSSNEVELPSCQ